MHDSVTYIGDKTLENISFCDDLSRYGCDVTHCLSINECLNLLKENSLNESRDIIIFQENMHDTHCLNFIHRLREYCNIPLIILGDAEPVWLKTHYLYMGADDYLQSPFHIEELHARMKAIMRRVVAKDTTYKAKTETVYFSNGFYLEPEHYQLYDADGSAKGLTWQEYKVLSCLVTHVGQTVSRDTIARTIKTGNYVPSARAIDIKITRIRKKIQSEDVDPEFISTVRGIGYRLNAKALL